MPEAAAVPALFGIVAEFDRPERLIEAARRTREAGFVRFETYSPFPIDALSGIEGFREAHVPRATLLGGIAGAAVGYGMQVYTNLDFPIDVGGRPLIAPPAFALITFELMVLFAVLAAVVTMLVLNRLPRLNHPLFEVATFHLASLDRFFLAIESRDPKFDLERTRAFLESLEPVRIDRAPLTETGR
jgi:hypothetical protein